MDKSNSKILRSKDIQHKKRHYDRGFKIIDHKGNVFLSVEDFCNHYGMTESQYHARKRQGLSIQEIAEYNNTHSVKKKEKIVDHLGNEYRSYKKMCEHYNIPYTTFMNRRKKGWTLEECLTRQEEIEKKKKEVPQLSAAERQENLERLLASIRKTNDKLIEREKNKQRENSIEDSVEEDSNSDIETDEFDEDNIENKSTEEINNTIYKELNSIAKRENKYMKYGRCENYGINGSKQIVFYNIMDRLDENTRNALKIMLLLKKYCSVSFRKNYRTTNIKVYNRLYSNYKELADEYNIDKTKLRLMLSIRQPEFTVEEILENWA